MGLRSKPIRRWKPQPDTKSTTTASRRNERALRIVVSIFLGVGLVFLAIAAFSFHLERRYRREGLQAAGIVLSKSSSTHGTGKHRSSSYTVRYRFTIPGGEQLESRDQIGRAEWLPLQAGSPLSVFYLRENPRSNRLAAKWAMVWIFGVFGTALVAVFGTALRRLSIA